MNGIGWLMALTAAAALVAVVGWVSYSLRRQAAGKRAAAWMDQGSFIQVGGVKTRLMIEGDGEPLLLIHGSQMSLYDWRFNIIELSKSFRVYALDMVGCGFSDKPQGEYSPEYFSEFIRMAMERLGLEKASLVASSWGGGHALHFALRYPERVGKLILSSPCGLPHKMNLTETLLATPAIANVMMLFVTKGLVRQQLNRAFEKKELIDDALVDSVYLPMFTRGYIPAIARQYRNADFSFVEKNLERIGCPVLIVWGTCDRIHARWMVDVLADRTAGSRLHVISGAGHMPHEEASAEFNRIALDFLKP